MKYSELKLKIPIEKESYHKISQLVLTKIDKIFKSAIKNNKNKIIINTNLKSGIPMENVNKIAGPFVEAWALETFENYLNDLGSKTDLKSISAGERLNMADIIIKLQSKNNPDVIVANIDVKATSQNIKNSGKSPNITSFSRIRSEYIKDPNYVFVILSIKHKVYSEKNKKDSMMMGVMEVIDFKSYDLKYISKKDLSYNPALGTGQIQLRDVHNVFFEKKTTKEFCELLDNKFLSSKKSFNEFYQYAKQNKWLIND